MKPEMRSDLKCGASAPRYTIGMLGRPLLFMGSEIGEAWSYAEPIDWESASCDPQKKQRLGLIYIL